MPGRIKDVVLPSFLFHRCTDFIFERFLPKVTQLVSGTEQGLEVTQAKSRPPSTPPTASLLPVPFFKMLRSVCQTPGGEMLFSVIPKPICQLKLFSSFFFSLFFKCTVPFENQILGTQGLLACPLVSKAPSSQLRQLGVCDVLTGLEAPEWAGGSLAILCSVVAPGPGA